MSLTDLLPMPALDSVNTGKSPCPTSFLIRQYGMPRANLTDQCQPVTSAFWKQRMETKDVGPFKATGHRYMLILLTRAFNDLKEEFPETYSAISNGGVLCCRHVRGHPGILSNHGLGLAIDPKIHGLYDPYGDGKVQRGLFDVYTVFKRHHFYWGVEFRKEDAMHFEVCAEKVMEWVRGGIF